MSSPRAACALAPQTTAFNARSPRLTHRLTTTPSRPGPLSLSLAESPSTSRDHYYAGRGPLGTGDRQPLREDYSAYTTPPLRRQRPRSDPPSSVYPTWGATTRSLHPKGPRRPTDFTAPLTTLKTPSAGTLPGSPLLCPTCRDTKRRDSLYFPH